MEIMVASHFSASQMSQENLDMIINLNGIAEGVEFRLPAENECTYSVDMSWVSFFMNQIESRLRLPPSYFFEQLSKKFCIPLCQFNPYSIRRAAALHVLCSFYSIADLARFIHATHSLKKAPPLYYLSPYPS